MHIHLLCGQEESRLGVHYEWFVVSKGFSMKGAMRFEKKGKFIRNILVVWDIAKGWVWWSIGLSGHQSSSDVSCFYASFHVHDPTHVIYEYASTTQIV